jgi:hypothetical protein
MMMEACVADAPQGRTAAPKGRSACTASAVQRSHRPLAGPRKPPEPHRSRGVYRRARCALRRPARGSARPCGPCSPCSDSVALRCARRSTPCVGDGAEGASGGGSADSGEPGGGVSLARRPPRGGLLRLEPAGGLLSSPAFLTGDRAVARPGGRPAGPARSWVERSFRDRSPASTWDRGAVGGRRASERALDSLRTLWGPRAKGFVTLHRRGLVTLFPLCGVRVRSASY